MPGWLEGAARSRRGVQLLLFTLVEMGLSILRYGESDHSLTCLNASVTVDARAALDEVLDRDAESLYILGASA